MDTAHSPLDIDRFRKVLARSRSSLHGGGHDPERETARRLAEKMAHAAGLSFEAAARMADGPSKSDNPFDFGRMWADFERAQRAKAEEAARYRFEETAHERMLREASASFNLEGRGTYPQSVGRKALRAIKDAIPWPANIADAVREVEAWDALECERRVRWDKYRLGDAAMIRRGLVLDYAIRGRARSTRDATARARWVLGREAFTSLSEFDREIGCETMLSDFERMAERLGAVTRENRILKVKRAASEGHPDRRTSAEKRAAVETVLRQPGADKLSLRQIADAAGVSHETARKVRAFGKVSKNDSGAVRPD
ncbi:protein of unassigned function [Methylobacterium oryzae CBMB20]|uniref:Protein of unassigned function n=1 Tax=Methylobacterium oryzae CBMB20 TaxID=693986 RepID=A0A089NS79_9HYPH|nr:protein of unassigned function [Methylobacterium oryzae CBMB20]